MDERPPNAPIPETSSTQSGRNEVTAEAWLQRGLLAHWERRSVAAADCYRRALDADPSLVLGRVWYAILLTEGDPQTAEQHLTFALNANATGTQAAVDRARETYEHFPGVLSVAGFVATIQDDRTMSKRWLQEAVRSNPNALAGHVWLTQLLIAENDVAGARECLERARSIAPADPSIKTLEAAAEVHECVLRDAVEKRVQDGLDRARRHVGKEEYDLARTELEALRQEHPDHVEVGQMLREVGVKLNERERAERRRRARENIDKAWGEVLLQHNVVAARGLVDKARRQAPGDSEVLRSIAEIDRALDVQTRINNARRTDAPAPRTYLLTEARDAVTQALGEHPASEGLRQLLASVESALATIQGIVSEAATESSFSSREALALDEPSSSEEAVGGQLDEVVDDSALQEAEEEAEVEDKVEEVAEDTVRSPLPATSDDPILEHDGTSESDRETDFRDAVEETISAWRECSYSRSAEAARRAYELSAQGVTGRDDGLRCGLVWIGLAWSSAADVMQSDPACLKQAARAIGRDDGPLRSDFNAHLLSHLAQSLVAGDRYSMDNLCLASNTPRQEDRELVQRVTIYDRLDDTAREHVREDLTSRATPGMGELVLHALLGLLGRIA